MENNKQAQPQVTKEQVENHIKDLKLKRDFLNGFVSMANDYNLFINQAEQLLKHHFGDKKDEVVEAKQTN